MAVQGIDLGKYQLGWRQHRGLRLHAQKGLNTDIVREISTRRASRTG